MTTSGVKTVIITALTIVIIYLIFQGSAYYKQLNEANSKVNKTEIQNQKYRNDFDSMKTISDYYKQKADQAKADVDRLSKVKEPIVVDLYKIKAVTQEVKNRDSLNSRHTDSSYCKNIEEENQKLWEVYGIDSTLIEGYKKILSIQDSARIHDSTMLDICNKAWGSETKSRRETESKLNVKTVAIKRWRQVAIVESIILAILVLKNQ